MKDNQVKKLTRTVRKLAAEVAGLLDTVLSCSAEALEAAGRIR